MELKCFHHLSVGFLSDHILWRVILSAGFIYLCKSALVRTHCSEFLPISPPHLAIIWTLHYLSISFFPGFFVIFTTGFVPLRSGKYCNTDVELLWIKWARKPSAPLSLFISDLAHVRCEDSHIFIWAGLVLMMVILWCHILLKFTLLI